MAEVRTELRRLSTDYDRSRPNPMSLCVSDLKEDMRRLESRYTELFEVYGDTPAAVQQSDRATQEVRMRRLCEIADVSKKKILDFGCGSGHLLKVLRDEFGFTGSYVGYDLSERILPPPRKKFPNSRFEPGGTFCRRGSENALTMHDQRRFRRPD